jgi:dienelactone hydrolase/predicted Ser/Thr protein kinase
MIGRTVGRYTITGKLGEGGMGVVYDAHDARLDRRVALKFLRAETLGDPDRKRRFQQEARAASALNHANIVTIHDIETAGDAEFIVMEYVDGTRLDRAIPPEGLPVESALRHAIQIASALAAAHGAHIVHRDLKPANIIVAPDGQAKVLDFGLAKLVEPLFPEETTMTAGPATAHGVILGTCAYMSPEQAEGRPADTRSDIFSFGTVLYEMLAGRRPFTGDSYLSTLNALVHQQPQPIRDRCRDVPPELERILERCLRKDPAGRYQTAAELHADLEECRAQVLSASGVVPPVPRRGKAWTAVLVGVALVLAAAGGVWLATRGARGRAELDAGMEEIEELTGAWKVHAAVQRARALARRFPGEPRPQQVLHDLTREFTITTSPPGADVYVTDYVEPGAEWEHLGRTPLENVRVPLTALRWRFAKEGLEAAELVLPLFSATTHEVALHAVDTAPPGMVFAPAGRQAIGSGPAVDLPAFWIDRHEVTNREFPRFVDAGGYRSPEHWKGPFLDDGRELSWQEAMPLFRDGTGRPGPATWELGTYPDGQEDFPVRGVSWYEAAAYAEFAGKSLPSIYHWRYAVGSLDDWSVSLVANFGGKAPARAGEYRDLGPFGTYNMAGNVKEWCWNPVGHRRYILGGAWNEPTYMAGQYDARPPVERAATHGFRTAQFVDPVPAAATAAIEALSRDYANATPVGDEVFEVYRRVYSYDRSELAARTEASEETDHWRKEKVSFEAAYGNERVTAVLLLPRNVAPPYQAVLWFPGSGDLTARSIDNPGNPFYFDFLPKSGRAVVIPGYQDMYERQLGAADRGPNLLRDREIQWSKDLGRTIDYLETRPDIDDRKIAYYGFSLGARDGPVLLALEPRLKTAVLLSGGLRGTESAPELDPVNFAPRVRIPVLMLNGTQDFIFPVESSQKPLFRLLGTPAEHKKHVLFEAGHAPPRIELIKHLLDWLDTYLGPV